MSNLKQKAMKFILGNYYTLIEENGANESGFVFKCDKINSHRNAIYGEEKYRATVGMCRNATTEEIIKFAESFTHPSDLIEKGKMFDEVQQALSELHRVTKAIFKLKTVQAIILGSAVEDVVSSAMDKAEILIHKAEKL